MCGGSWRNSVYLTGVPDVPLERKSLLGCYEDHSQRTLPSEFASMVTNGGKACIAHCQSKGFAVAGTQYGFQCFCGNSIPPVEKDAAECNTPCQGNPKELCGGSWRNSVYLTGLSLVSSNSY